MKNGAEALVKAVREAGITVCFTNPGTTDLPLVAALSKSSVGKKSETVEAVSA